MPCEQTEVSEDVVAYFIRRNPRYAYLVDELESEANFIEGAKHAEAQTKDDPAKWLRQVIWLKLISFAASYSDLAPSWQAIRDGASVPTCGNLDDVEIAYDDEPPALLDDILDACHNPIEREIVRRRLAYETYEEIADAMGLCATKVGGVVRRLACEFT